MGVLQRQAGVLEGSAGRGRDPEGPLELQPRQPGRGLRFVPRLQGGVDVEFRVLDDLVAEAVDDRGDGEDAAEPLVQARLGCSGASSGVAPPPPRPPAAEPAPPRRPRRRPRPWPPSVGPPACASRPPLIGSSSVSMDPVDRAASSRERPNRPDMPAIVVSPPPFPAAPPPTTPSAIHRRAPARAARSPSASSRSRARRAAAAYR